MGSVPQELGTTILNKNDVWKMHGAGNDLHQGVHGLFYHQDREEGAGPLMLPYSPWFPLRI